MGVALIDLGELAEAERLLHVTLVLAGVANGWEFVHWQPLIHYAETALSLGHADSASKYFTRVVNQARDRTNQYWEVRGLFGLARAQVESGELGQARRTLASFKAVKERFPKMNETDDQVPDANTLDGWIAFAVGDAALAHQYFMTALSTNGYFDGKRLERLRSVVIMAAETALMMGNADSARILAGQAREIATTDSLAATRSDRVGEANLIDGLALLAGGDTARARPVLGRALTALRRGAGETAPRTQQAVLALQALGAAPDSN